MYSDFLRSSRFNLLFATFGFISLRCYLSGSFVVTGSVALARVFIWMKVLAPATAVVVVAPMVSSRLVELVPGVVISAAPVAILVVVTVRHVVGSSWRGSGVVNTSCKMF